jgi:hypothetical protein
MHATSYMCLFSCADSSISCQCLLVQPVNPVYLWNPEDYPSYQPICLSVSLISQSFAGREQTMYDTSVSEVHYCSVGCMCNKSFIK